jgi:hypothetical protein
MFNQKKRRTRRLVQRYYSERYLLLTLLSFALSVSFTRLFLEITGYPQLGGSELHFAHVLWGGLVWFAGSLFPLIFANHRALDISAILTGIGSGLFIDEIGKFITQSNDYFYPAAAPVIYAFFLLTLFIFSLNRKRRDFSLREHLYRTIEQFEEILEGDLSSDEKNRMIEDLTSSIEEKDSEELRNLAVSIQKIILDHDNLVEVSQPDILAKIDYWWLQTKNRLFHKGKAPTWLFGVWFFLGIISVVHPVVSIYAARSGLTLPGIWNQLIEVNLNMDLGIRLFEQIRLVGEAIIGLLLMTSAVIGFLGWRKLAVAVSYTSILILLVLINLLVFYYDQFSAIVFTIIHFAVFFLTRQYRLEMNE